MYIAYMGLLAAQLAVQNLLSSVYGYISGTDLAGWCDPQLLITAEAKVPTTLRRAVNQAIAEIQSALQNRYDLTTELLKTDVISPFAIATLTKGVVTALQILQPGAGLTITPAVSFVNDPTDTTGNDAAATAGISQGYVDNIYLITNGYGFRQPPIVTISGGGGSGATAVAILETFGPNDVPPGGDPFVQPSPLPPGAGLPDFPAVGLNTFAPTVPPNYLGRIASIQITNGGLGYTSPPTVTITSVDGFGVAANAAASINLGKLVSLQLTAGGVEYTAVPSVVFDMSQQLADTRNAKLVKIITIYAIRNAMGQAQNVSEQMGNFFKMADTMVADLKSGADSLPLFGAQQQVRSGIQLIQDRFHTLG